MTTAKPAVVDAATWKTALADLRRREKATTRELDAIAAQRRRLPMVELPEYTLIGADGPVRLADVFGGRTTLHTGGEFDAHLLMPLIPLMPGD